VVKSLGYTGIYRNDLPQKTYGLSGFSKSENFSVKNQVGPWSQKAVYSILFKLYAPLLTVFFTVFI
jgi:hypothetical protein